MSKLKKKKLAKFRVKLELIMIKIRTKGSQMTLKSNLQKQLILENRLLKVLFKKEKCSIKHKNQINL